MPKVAVLLGSLRRPGMGFGIASWLTPLVRQSFQTARTSTPDASSVDVVLVDPTQPPLPLGPIVDGSHVPADIRDPTKHPNPAVREWAMFVTSCSGFIILCPEYNKSYPGELKNTFDHLYWEWARKPVMVVAYGGGGGARVEEALRGMLGGPFKMQVADKGVGIKWPRGTDKVPPEGPAPKWLQAYEPEVLAAVEELNGLILKNKA
ncbi:flavoprotein [Epithele typhae]|uniref:flavoprotein n=1 Tax=Epithele typhae TaxID=378194 RepID=UPI002008C71F|nr:flavoprotein [Epithele typhae]KAH9944324.1 flavoprotein [Epithele typhae]